MWLGLLQVSMTPLSASYANPKQRDTSSYGFCVNCPLCRCCVDVMFILLWGILYFGVSEFCEDCDGCGVRVYIVMECNNKS